MNPEQTARVEALRRAREALQNDTDPTPPDTYDLVTVARWILTGEDPWPDAPPDPSVLQDLTADYRPLPPPAATAGRLVAPPEYVPVLRTWVHDNWPDGPEVVSSRPPTIDVLLNKDSQP